MNQFGKILKFELSGYLKNKVFVGVTVFLVIAITIAMFIPNISAMFKSDEEAVPDVLPGMLIYADDPEFSSMVGQYFSEAFPDYAIMLADGSLEDVKAKVVSGDVQCAFVMDSLDSYTYYVNNLSMYDANMQTANSVLQEVYRVTAMVQGGMSPEQAEKILSAQIQCNAVTLGKDQMQNFFYTYIMIFALYMVILLYGQMVATNVAIEKVQGLWRF